jgi:prepilin-type N-terminal cleavage/methylation domain-containing protein
MKSRGFTLLEVILAVTLSGVVVLIGALFWRQSLNSGASLANHRLALDRQEGAIRWIQAAIGSIDVGTEGDVPFTGRQDEIHFSTWLPTVNGWPERRAVTLAAEDGALTLVVSPGESLQLMDSVTVVAFDYLLEPGLNSQWASDWESPASAPVAIRVRIAHGDGRADTLLLLVRSRG